MLEAIKTFKMKKTTNFIKAEEQNSDSDTSFRDNTDKLPMQKN